MLDDPKWNFERIRHAIDAASHAQDAGYSDKAREILFKLADEIRKEPRHD